MKKRIVRRGKYEPCPRCGDRTKRERCLHDDGTDYCIWAIDRTIDEPILIPLDVFICKCGYQWFDERGDRVKKPTKEQLKNFSGLPKIYL